MTWLPSPNMIFRPVRWWRYWLKLYAQWEFWALTLGAMVAYGALEGLGLLPAYLQSEDRARWAIAAVILLPMPYLIARKERRLAGRDDWFVSGLPYIIGGLVLITLGCFALPVFLDPETHHALSGLTIMIHQPFVLVVPVLYLVSAWLLFVDYNEWRIVSALWIFGAFAGMWAAAAYYADLQPNPDPVMRSLNQLAFTLPIIACIMCCIRQQPRR
jgi:hypothetical protein